MNGPSLRGRRRSGAAGAWVELVAAAAVMGFVAWLVRANPATPPAVRRPGPVAVIGMDGLTWAVLAPLLARGATPTLAGMKDAQRAAVVGSETIPLREVWRAIPVWDHGARMGRKTVLVSWPSQPGVWRCAPAPGARTAQTVPLAPVVDHPVLQPPSEPPLPPELSARLARDLGTSVEAARLVTAERPDLLLVGLRGPQDLERGRPERPVPLPASYGRLLDQGLGRLIAALGPDASIVIIGRGIGRPGAPDGQGVWLASGPGLAVGPLPAPMRTIELAASVLALEGLPMLAGVPARPSPWIFAEPARDRRTVRWSVR